MPIRVYDIGKKLGLEMKVVLAKARELGIRDAKVPSSSLDDFAGKLLEAECRKAHPYVPPSGNPAN